MRAYSCTCPSHFYPRPPRGGRPIAFHVHTVFQCDFYPRPPRGGRPCRTFCTSSYKSFLSTSSARRTTRSCRSRRTSSRISTHVLREENDVRSDRCAIPKKDFYPRPPRGGRLKFSVVSPDRFNFYPRPPRGGRLLVAILVVGINQFLSTSSARRTTSETACIAVCIDISIHVLREEDDLISLRLRSRVAISIHVLREEDDQKICVILVCVTDFYPRPPRGGRHTS